MSFTDFIQSAVFKSLEELYGQVFTEKDFQVNQTKPEFEGDYTVVMFSLVKNLKVSPEILVNNWEKILLKIIPVFFRI